MANLREIAQDPDFQSLPDREKLKALKDVDPDLSSLSFNEQMKALKDLTSIQEPIIPASTTPDVPEWGRKNPNLYGIAGAARETLAPIVEGVAMAGGALAGAPSGPMGSVAGAGLGYAGANKLVEMTDVALGNKAEAPLAQQVQELPSQIATGMGMEAGGQVVGKGVEALAAAAPRVYQSALKPLTTIKPSEVDKRIETALRNHILVSKGSLKKSQAKIKEINNTISEKIADATGVTVSRDRALVPVANLGDKVVKKNITPDSDLKSIASYVDEVQSAQPEQIPIQAAQEFKKTLNRELDDFYKSLKSGKATPPQITAQSKAAMADGLRNEMTSIYPELKTLNAEEGALIELNKSLGRAVARITNREIIPLIAGIGFGTTSTSGLLRALAIKAVDHPQVKSALAIALYEAGKKNVSNLTNIATKSAILGLQ